jgi:hypothetical protein
MIHDLEPFLQRARFHTSSGRQGPQPTAAAKMGSLVRPLGCSERFFYFYSLAFPVHFCLVAEIEGAIDPVKLHAALEQVRRRHPALRVCIIDDAEAGPAFCRTDNPIEVYTAPVEADAQWRLVVEDELNRPFDTVPCGRPFCGRPTALRSS